MLHRRPVSRLMRSACFVIFVTASVATSSAQPLTRTAKETRLGEVDLSTYDAKKPTFWVSPDGRHIAYQTEKGIVIDGVAQDYDYGVKEKSFTFSPDSQRHAYVAIVSDEGRSEVLVVDGERSKGYSSVGSGPVFSPDSKHVGCIPRLRASSFDMAPLIDGREGPPIESTNWEAAFTGDSKRFVYGVETGDDYVMRSESVDDTEPVIDRPHAPYKMVDNFFRGPENQLGYIARTDEHQRFVVYDGKEDPRQFKEIDRDDVLVSENGKGIAYVAEPSSFRNVVVHNGKVSKEYDDFEDGTLAISPDGKHCGYVIEVRKGYRVVLDGKEQPIYEKVAAPGWSPDSSRVAYLALKGGKVMSVVDGKEGKPYDNRGFPVFSPDSKTAAFWAQIGEKGFVVLNGQRQKEYDATGNAFISSDSKRLAYLARTGDEWRVVLDAKEFKLYDDVDPMLYFSPDSQHLANIAHDGEQEMVVIDGVEGTLYDDVITLDGAAEIYFDAPDQLHYLASKGGEVFLVEETISP
jgi:hypothetical protein